MKAFLNKYFLALLLTLALIAGFFCPSVSQSFARYRHIFLFVIMFFVGLEQQLSTLLHEGRKFPTIGFSLVFNYGVFSLLAWGCGWLFFRGQPIVAGFAVLGAVPVTLTSAVLFTRLDRGNDRLALVIVFLSQVLGVVITPLLIRFFMATAIQVDTGRMMGQLLFYFLFPLLLGMVARRFLPLDRLVRYLTRPEQMVIAFFVFVGAGQIPAGSPWGLLGKSLLAVLLLQAVISIVFRGLVKKFPSSDQSALFYTMTQKTLPAGLYLILTYFPGAAIVPMVFYHLAQLTIGPLYWQPPQTPCKAQGEKR